MEAARWRQRWGGGGGQLGIGRWTGRRTCQVSCHLGLCSGLIGSRPTRKARRKKHSHGDSCRHSPPANKYDIQPKNKE